MKPLAINKIFAIVSFENVLSFATIFTCWNIDGAAIKFQSTK